LQKKEKKITAVNKKTTLNIFLAKFRKYFKISFSQYSGVSLGSKGLFGVIFLNSFCNRIKVLILPI